jgi:hypothetical protein
MGRKAAPPLTAAQRRQRARIAAIERSAHNDTKALAVPLRAGYWRRFLLQVDPEGVLDDAERERRARAAHRAYMLKLALRSSRVRQARKATREAGAGGG